MARSTPRPRRLIGAALGLTLSIGAALAVPAGASAATPAHRDAPQSLGQHVAVPAYIPPSDSASWSALEDAGPQLGVVIANPASGPGSTVDPSWQGVISATHADGTKVIGYVDTGYFGFTGRRTAGGSTDPTAWLVQAELDVDRWYAFYGNSLDGIFFDDVENVCGPTEHSEGYVDLYRELNDFVHYTHPGSLTVANPGIAVPQCYEDAADILLTFEGSEADYLNPPSDLAPQPWQLRADPGKFWNIIYGVPQSDLPKVMAASKSLNAGYVYATPRTLDSNPYLALPDPDYFNAELAASDAADAGRVPRPARPRVTNVTATAVTLQWVPTGGTRAVGYDIYANGVVIGSASNGGPRGTRFTASNLQPATNYAFTIRARDKAGSLSAPTQPIRVTTHASRATPPTTPAPLTATSVGPASVTLAWAASTQAHGHVAYYDIFENGVRVLVLNASATTVSVGDLLPQQTYTFAVDARDDSGATSAQSNGLTVTTPSPAGGGVTDPVVTATATTVTFQAMYNLPYTFQNIFIDADADPATGYSITVGGHQIGADYLIENGAFYSYVGPGFSWSQVAGVNPLVSDDNGLYTWQIPTNELGSGVTVISVVFNGSGGFPDAYTDVVTAAVP